MTTKIRLLALALAIMLLLSACGGGTTPPPTVPPAQNGDANGDTNGADEDVGPLARGTISGVTYSSDLAQLTFTLPDDGWDWVDDDVIAEMMGITVDMMADEMDLSELDIQTLYDMVAAHDSGTNIIVAIEDLTNHPGGRLITVTALVEALKGEMEALDIMSYTFRPDSEIAIRGNTYVLVTADVEMQGLHFVQHYLVRRQGNYMISVIISLFDGMSIDDIMPHFS